MQLDVTSPRNPGPPVKAAITRTVSADPLPVATFTATASGKSASGDTPAHACLALADELWPAKAAAMKPAKAAADAPAVTP